MIQNVVLPDVPDSIPVALPKGCHMEQIAIQKWDSNLYVGEERYTINEGLWNLLDADNQAVLVIHELALRSYLHLDDASRRARFFTGLVIQSTIPMNAYIGMLPFGDQYTKYTVKNRDLQMDVSSTRLNGYIVPAFKTSTALAYIRNDSFRKRFMDSYFLQQIPLPGSHILTTNLYVEYFEASIFSSVLGKNEIPYAGLVTHSFHQNGKACLLVLAGNLFVSGKLVEKKSNNDLHSVVYSEKGKACGTSILEKTTSNENFYMQVDPSPECAKEAIFKGGRNPCK
jgi:hypothetical protein